MKVIYIPFWMLYFCSVIILSPAWGLPVVGRVDTFENGTTQGWGGSYSTLTPLPMNITSGGPAGPNDNYLEISTDGFHLATRNQTRAWGGDYLHVRVKAISMDLMQLGGNADVRLRLALFGAGGMFATVARTRPLNERPGWMHHTFHLGKQDLMHVSGGTGILEDTLGKVETLLIRHDAENPAPPGTHPPHIKATVGIDNIKAVLREYDVAWEFGNQGNESYVLAEIDPSHIHLGELNGENPHLTLFVGQRYQITVDDPETHPLEIIAKGPTADQDRVLLSMSSDVTAPFAGDAGVDWHDAGNGTVTFTLTRDLWSALHREEGHSPGYRCANHSQAMRGDFSIME